MYEQISTATKSDIAGINCDIYNYIETSLLPHEDYQAIVE